MAKMMLEKAGVVYKAIDAEENPTDTAKYGVKKAPTLLVPNGDKIDRYENASEIKRFVESGVNV